MATFVFDGTANVSIANFNPATDTVIVDGVDVADVSTLGRTSSSFTLTTSGGFTLSLAGALTTLSSTNFGVSGGSDIVFAIGGGGNDAFAVSNLGSGGLGIDQFQVTTADALIYGNEDNDFIDGNSNENLHAFGGSGSDFIAEVGNGSVVYGGVGSDTIDAAAATESITVYGGNGSSDPSDSADYINSGGGDDLIYGNTGNDTIFGNAGDDALFGGQGDDFIGGGIGDDSIYGNAGNDTIVGQGGSDFLFGGQGNDSISATAGALTDDVLVSGGLGEDTIDASASGSDGITIYGGNGASDTTDGGDQILGSNQGDLIYGNFGDDSIAGGAGKDVILGGAGDDTIAGDNGLNTVTGGLGADTFVAVINNNPTDDYSVVTDFQQGTDVIDLTTTVTAGHLETISPAGEFDTYAEVYAAYGQNFAGGGVGDVRVVVITAGDLAGTTFVLGDENGGGIVDDVIALTGFTGTLTVDDFV